MTGNKSGLRNIPTYEGGEILLEINSGSGFNDDRIQLDEYETVFRVGDEYTEEELTQKILDMKKTNRAHFEMSHEGLAGRLISDTRLVHFRWKDGKITSVNFLDPEPSGNTDTDSCLRIIRETSAEEFNTYIRKLVDDGFKVTFENQVEDNLFRELVKDDVKLYTYYMANTRTVRILEDSSAVSVADFGYECGAVGGEKCEVYQYGHYYARMKRGFACDCGMLYIVKLSDNSVFIIDGGKYEQSSDRVVEHVMKLLRNMSKTSENEKIRIAGYFVTHAHDDHMDLFSKLIRLYHSQLSLERVIFNFPSRDFFALSPENYIMKERIKKYYPDVKYLKPHTGQRFMLADSLFEVIQTHEDVMGEVDLSTFKNLNDTSTVIRIGMGEGKTFTVLADIDKNAERVMLGHYSNEYLKTDVVQVAHHLINLLDYLYDAMSPSVALIPQHSERRYVEPNPKLDAVRRSVKEDNIYFAYDGTDGFRAEEDGISHFFHEEPLGIAGYDGSES